MSEAFTNRIAWVAARTLLVRASADAGTDAALRADIDRFLERNPA